MVAPERLPSFVRDYLYVDVARTRSLLAQLDEGVVEKRITETSDDEKRERRVGTRGTYLGKTADFIVRDEYERALSETLFGYFEDLAENAGILVDLSDELSGEKASAVSLQIPAGTLVRITGPTSLFDSAYLRSSFKNIVSVARGFSSIDGDKKPVAAQSARQKGAPKPRPGGGSKERGGIEPDERDDAASAILGGLHPTSMGSMAEVVEGIFPSGVWVLQRLGVDGEVLVSARCTAASEYLEQDRDALFSRYGVGYSEWTLVGLVGNRQSLVPDVDMADIGAKAGFDRAKMADTILGLMSIFGKTGFTEAPEKQNFAVTPLSLYRVVAPWKPTI